MLERISSLFKITNDEAICRFISAMMINRFHEIELSEEDFRILANQFFTRFEGRRGITISRDEYIKRTTELLIKIKIDYINGK